MRVVFVVIIERLKILKLLKLQCSKYSTYSFCFAQSPKTVIKTKSVYLHKSYYVCQSEKNIICSQYIQAYRNQEWANFSNYVDWLTEVIRVDIEYSASCVFGTFP